MITWCLAHKRKYAQRKPKACKDCFFAISQASAAIIGKLRGIPNNSDEI